MAMEWYRIYGVRIYLDTAETDPDLLAQGLYTQTMENVHTTIGSRTLTFPAPYLPFGFIPGRKILISNGFPSSTHYYLIKSVVSNTIILDDSEDVATSSVSDATVQQQSEFRWAEVFLQAYEENGWQQWKGDMLAENPIDAIEEGGNTTNGGCLAEYKGLEFTVCNADKLLSRLANAGVMLNNCKVEIYELSMQWNSITYTPAVIFTGVCEEITWNESDLVVSCKNTRYKRNASHSVVLSNGIIVPMTFGSLKPEDYSTIINLAKALRKNNEIDESYYTNAFFNGTHPEINIFPVVNLANQNCLIPGATNTYYPVPCKITIKINGNAGAFSIADNTIMEVVDGNGKGQFALVDSITTTGTPDELLCTIKTMFKTDLSKESNDTKSWVRFILVDRNYCLDSWPCRGFMDKYGNFLSSDAELYALSNEKMIKVSDLAYDFIGVADKNELNIRIDFCSEDINKILSYIILPVKNLALITSANLNEWDGLGAYYYKIADGVFINYATPPTGFQYIGASLQNPPDAIDKNHNTYAIFTPKFKDGSATGTTVWIICALQFELPDLPADVDINSVHLGIHMVIKCHGGAVDYFPKFHVQRYRWPGLAFQKTTDRVSRPLFASGLNRTDGFTNANLPNDYYGSAFDGKNYAFMKELPDTSEYFRTGLDTFKIPSVEKSNYNQLNIIGLFTQIAILKDVWYDWEHLFKEVAIILSQGTIDVGKELFTPFAGRVFNDTWGGRKTATNMVSNPIEITEMIRRLGNWSETGEKKNWGKEYAETAKIKISGEGSFDDASLADIKSFSPAFQIFEESKMNSESILGSLCKTFDFCSYIDADGNECVSPLYKTNPAETIELGDVVGDIGDIREPDANDVFCEPVVRYGYDASTDSFLKTLSVTNIDAESWQESYTPGFNATDGEIVWNKCKALYVKFRQITLPDADFTDQIMITTYADAVKYLIAKLDKMARRRVPLSVYYEKGKDYHFAKHVMLNLEYQTNTYSLECFVENIRKSKNKNLVELVLVLIDDIPIIDFIIQEIAAGGSPERGKYQEKTTDALERYQDTANQRG